MDVQTIFIKSVPMLRVNTITEMLV